MMTLLARSACKYDSREAWDLPFHREDERCRDKERAGVLLRHAVDPQGAHDSIQHGKDNGRSKVVVERYATDWRGEFEGHRHVF